MGWIGSPPPASVSESVDRVRQAATDCDVMFHTDESVVMPQRRDAVARFIPQWRSDVLRHAVLEQYGGLWLDCDVRLLASPATWTAAWDRYTAIKLGNSPLVGTDILFVPRGWGGWQYVNDYIDKVLATAGDRVEVLAIAGSMIRRLARQQPDLFSIVSAPSVFPFSAGEFTAASVVARSFDPSANPPPAMPSLAQRAATFASAAARHVAAGMPRATDEEIERRFAICQGCEHFDGKACRQCGCPIVREKRFVSKLSWGNEACPAGKW